MENKLEKYKNFCPVPWKQFASTTDGYQRACCTMSLEKKELENIAGISKDQLDNIHDLEDGLYIFNKGKKLKISDGIESYINSDSITNIKNMFANNIAPYQCRCYYTEQFHPDSRRVAYLQAYNIKTDHDVEQFIKQPTHDIDYYDIRLGNVCNLQCLMCGPNLSNQLYEEAIYRAGVDSIMIDPGLEIKKVDGKLVYDKQIESKIFNWADDNFFRDLEAKVVADLSLNPDKKITFYMIGGEPLLNEYHFRFLERLVELGLSKNITLEYNTNLTVVTDYIITLWSKFRRMVLAISIDDVGDRYEYIRYPSKWSKISNNLMAISQAIKQYPDVFSTVNVVAVVNFFTAYNFHTLVDTMSQYDINVYKIISTGPVVTTPAVLTDEEKQQYIELLKNTADRQELVDYVNSFTYNDDARKEFSHMLKFWESKRRKPFAEVFPELAAILKIN